MDILYTIGALFIMAPALVFILIVLIARKRLGYRSIGLAADMTTWVLFFSVPAAAAAIWQIEIVKITWSAAIITAILLLIVEWKQTKEIEIGTLTRKTWRAFFLLLSLAHFLLCLAGVVWTFKEFFES